MKSNSEFNLGTKVTDYCDPMLKTGVTWILHAAPLTSTDGQMMERNVAIMHIETIVYSNQINKKYKNKQKKLICTASAHILMLGEKYCCCLHEKTNKIQNDMNVLWHDRILKKEVGWLKIAK